MSRLSRSISELNDNPQQWKAFQVEGHCVVLAPPGSGKTKLLTTRLAYDLFNRIPEPHGAACVTLTIAAADELRRRLSVLGVPDRSTLFVGTVHSFAMRQIIAPFAKLAGRGDVAEASIASDRQKSDAYDEAISEVFSPGADTRNVRSTIEFLRKRMADEADWARSGDEIVAVHQRYLAKLQAQRLIDFEEAVQVAVELVERHNIVRRMLTARYPRLYVDEYQDLAPGLDTLVQLLCFDYVNNAELFAVGDPEQALYGWTGSQPELLIQLADRCDVTDVVLEHNYRCGQEIIRIANMLQRGRQLVVGSRTGGQVTAHHHPGGFADQCQGAVHAAAAAIRRGVPLHEIVVICPMNNQCTQVAAALRTAGIPAFVRSSDYRLSASTVLVEGCAAWAVLGRETSGYRLRQLLGGWRQLLGPSWTRQHDVQLTELLMSYADSGDDAANELLTSILDHGLRQAVARPSQSDEAAEINQMTQALTTGSLSDLTVRGLAERARKVDRVEVTTMLSSKGLEFDVVLILGADEGLSPHFLSVKDPELLKEDRRKFYVSITRARDEVRIFYSGFVEWASGKSSRNGPSRFLQEIGLDTVRPPFRFR